MNIVGAFSGFSVNDQAVARQFYVEKLGLPAGDESMGLQLKLPGGSTVFIYEKSDHTPASYTVLNLVVEDIDASVDELVKAGITLERYEDMGNGAKQDPKGILRGLAANMGPDIAWFKDPAGNILSILQDA